MNVEMHGCERDKVGMKVDVHPFIASEAGGCE
jgi:hypothetical protein